MMSTEYSYDEEGYLWPFFVFVLTSIITLPLTYLVVVRSRDPAAPFARVQTDFKPPHDGLIRAQKVADKRKQQRKFWLVLTAIAGWLIMGYMMYLIQSIDLPERKIYNPYDILGIAETANEKAIKSTYKKLSRKFHPDKVKPDSSKNETFEMINARYVEITKAYQSLTDEDTRNNFLQYGHPDGKQTMSIGIALPKIIVSDGNGKYVVLVYFMLFGVLLPYLVGSWWYGTQRRSKEGVLMESANRLFHEYDETLDESGVVTALSTAKEFEETLHHSRLELSLARVESRIFAPGEDSDLAAGLSDQSKTKLQGLESGARRTAAALLWAYLGRLELDNAMTAAKFQVAPIAHDLTRSMLAISLAYGNTRPILSSYYASQLLIQAMPPKASPLLQLPHFTPAIAKAIDGGDDAPRHNKMTVQAFMDQPDSVRRQQAVGPNLLTPAQYESAVKVAKQLPYFRVAKAFFKVAGERFIIPSSLVSLVVKGRFIPPGSENVPAINGLDLEDVDPPEDDIDAILGRKPKRSVVVKGESDETTTTTQPNDQQPVAPALTHAPYFARDYSPRWNFFLTDSKQGRITVPPTTYAYFERPIFEADGQTPTFNMQTLKAQFQAPSQAGHYTFVMHLICDSYVGFDTKMGVTLVVEEASKAAAMAADDEISEPEEDSIAGIMSAAKGNPPPRKKVQESSDDESGTDDDDDTSVTNTDTEEEDNST